MDLASTINQSANMAVIGSFIAPGVVTVICVLIAVALWRTR